MITFPKKIKLELQLQVVFQILIEIAITDIEIAITDIEIAITNTVFVIAIFLLNYNYI